jgi:hypothetical protein
MPTVEKGKFTKIGDLEWACIVPSNRIEYYKNKLQSLGLHANYTLSIEDKNSHNNNVVDDYVMTIKFNNEDEEINFIYLALQGE